MSAEPVAILTSKAGVAVPLKRVTARGRLEGLVLELTVEQRYENTSATNLEAVFTFPLPLRAVLLGFDLDLGGRKLSAVAIARRAASERYEKAIDEGDTAALVEHDGNGLYTVSVGNLLAGETATLRYRYAELLDAHDRRVRINVPTVIAPRYGNPRDAGLEGPAVPGVDSLGEYPFEITLDLDGLTDAEAVTSPSHAISVTPTPAGLTVAPRRAGFLDRDFVLELAAGAIPDRVLVAADGDNFVALASPRLRLDAVEHRPLALKVLLDCSGSMNGDSILAAKRALTAILERLEPADSVSLTRFGSRTEHVTEGLEPADDHTLAPLKLRVRELAADLGGTEMRNAIATTLKIPLPRTAASADLVLITDGEIYDVERVVDLTARSGHRLFAIAIGAAPNEALARALAEKTGGACEFVAAGEDAEQAILRTFKRLRSAPRSIARVDWPVSPTWTTPLPSSVFAGDTLHLFAGFERRPSDTTTITVGDAAGRSLPIAMDVSAADTAGDLLSRLAAARRLPTLSADEAAALAVRYQLASEHTSFVVVAERSEAEKAAGLPTTVAVSHMLAAGWGGVGRADEAILRCAMPSLRESASILSRAALASRRAPAEVRAVHDEIQMFCLDDAHTGPAPRSTTSGLPRELTLDVRAAAWHALAAYHARNGRLPTTFDELVGATAMPDSLALYLRTLIEAGQPEEMVVAVFLALLARGTPPDAGDTALRAVCEGAVFSERRYRALRRRLEGVVNAAP